MNVRFQYHKKLNDKIIEKELLKILMLHDEDFVPTLSSSRLKENKNATKEDKLKKYIEEKKEEDEFIFVFEEGKLIGFMNFINDYKNKKISERLKSKNPYLILVDTMVFLSNYQQKGLGQKLYSFFVETIKNEIKNNNIHVIRATWDYHIVQIHLYEKQDYSLLYKEPYYRNDGFNYVYYSKQIKN